MSGICEERQQVANIMAATWIAFARTGNPNNPKTPAWPPYNVEWQPVMVLGVSPKLVPDARGAQRRLIDGTVSHLNRYQR